MWKASTPSGANRYYQIEKPLARIAEDLGLVARMQKYKGNAKQDPGDSASRVVTLTRDVQALGDLGSDARWQPLQSEGGRLWTDDYAHLLSIIKGMKN